MCDVQEKNLKNEAQIKFVVEVIDCLRGSYNTEGVIRWFLRKRRSLNKHSPYEILRGNWTPDDPGVKKILELAKRLR